MLNQQIQEDSLQNNIQEIYFEKIKKENDNFNVDTKIFEDSFWVYKAIPKKKGQILPKKWGHKSIIYEKYMYIFGG